jgi:hypothetical protein
VRSTVDGGALSALERLYLDRIPASGASKQSCRH